MMIRAVQFLGYDIEVVGLAAAVLFGILGGGWKLFEFIITRRDKKKAARADRESSERPNCSQAASDLSVGVHPNVSGGTTEVRGDSPPHIGDYATLKLAEIAIVEGDLVKAKELFGEIRAKYN